MDTYQPVPSPAISSQFNAARGQLDRQLARIRRTLGTLLAPHWRPGSGHVGRAQRRGWRTAARSHRDIATARCARLGENS
jgi:hypothetical protein